MIEIEQETIEIEKGVLSTTTILLQTFSSNEEALKAKKLEASRGKRISGLVSIGGGILVGSSMGIVGALAVAGRMDNVPTILGAGIAGIIFDGLGIKMMIKGMEIGVKADLASRQSREIQATFKK